MKINAWNQLIAVGLLTVCALAHGELVDRGNGLIYDTVLDITWLQDANYSFTSGYDDDGKMTWYEAVAWADQLVYEDFDDWRLASISVSAGTPTGTLETLSSIVDCYADTEEACRDNEYAYMFRYNLGGWIGESLTGEQVSVNDVGLHNIQYAYWSNTAFADFYEAFVFFFGGGGIIYDAKTSRWAAWAVRDGDVDDIPCTVPDTPTNLTAKLRRGTVYLSWQSSEEATSYDVYRRVNDADFVFIASTAQVTFVDEPPADAQVVDYYIVALNDCGQSSSSEISSILLKNSGGGKGQ